MIINPYIKQPGSAEILKQRDGLQIRQICDGRKSAEHEKSAKRKISAIFASAPLSRQHELKKLWLLT
jgi:hypothetical protein